jgi:hypothetical protein
LATKKSSPRPLPTTTDIHPLNNIIIGKKNRSVITDITVLTEDKKTELTRSPTSFYISQNIAKGWRQYCKMSGKPTHELTEDAFIEFMRSHPLPQATLNVTQDLVAYAPDVKTRLRNKILRDKIISIVSTLRRMEETGRGDKASFKQQLQKLVLQVTNLKHPDADLMELLKEAEDLI